MKRAALLVFCLGTALIGKTPSAIAPEVQTAMDKLDGKQVVAHMRFLADDLLEGRGPGTRGHELAAKYVAAQFEALGLKPAGDKGTYYQRVPFRNITIDSKDSHVTLTRNGKPVELKWGEDFMASGHPVNPEAVAEAPIVFVGFGVVAPDQHYDDYAGIDCKGKIVASLYGAPPTFPSDARAHYSSGRMKARAAAAHGAVGMINLATPDMLKALPWDRFVIGAGFPALRWLGPDGKPNDYFPEIKAGATLSVAAAEHLFEGTSKTWKQVLDEAKEGKPKAFALPVTAKLHIVSKHRDISSPNVAAILPGSDPQLKDEYVIYTAHTDHLGIGAPIRGQTIYHGALDNASGTAALIVLADAFVHLPKAPARSMLFVAVTAEEKGLLGADYFVHYPTVPAKSLVANLNMDGASLFYEFKDVIAEGAEHTSLENLISQDCTKLGLSLVPDPMPEQNSFIRGDQYSFVRGGIPAVQIAEGLTAKDPNFNARKYVEEWIANRYHSPFDDMDQPLNTNATTQFLQINFLVGNDVADTRERPTWNKGDFFGDQFGGK